MSYEQFSKQEEKQKKQTRKFTIDKSRLFITIALVLLGAFMFGFKYLAWTFPTNSLIRDSDVYHDHSVFLALYENEDNYIFVFESGILLDIYDKETETKVYGVTLQQLTGSIGTDYDLLLTQGGYVRVPVFGYRILGFVQAAGVVLAVVSVLLFFFGRGYFSREDFEVAKGEAKLKVLIATQEVKNANRNPNNGGQKPPV
ncbi:MAG: hypothetical protein JXL85_05975 [Bacilli bacterium]|nr:hypothetical protein [Bacilli bacterium]